MKTIASFGRTIPAGEKREYGKDLPCARAVAAGTPDVLKARTEEVFRHET